MLLMYNRFAQRAITSLLINTLLVSGLWAQQPFVLTDGTPMRVRLNRNLSSADARVGEPVDFDVVEDVMVNGIIVIQRGSTALATVTEAKQKGRMGKAGKLDVNIDHARSVLGEKVALRAIKENEGGGNTGKMTGAMVATSIVFFPAAPLFLFMKGKDVTIPKGTEITAYIHGDMRLDEARFRAHPANAGVQAPSGGGAVTGQNVTTVAATAAPPQTVSVPTVPSRGMKNGDVLDLKRAGFSDDLIVSKIRSSQCAFSLETSDLIEMKKAGLSDKVIGTMMEKIKP
jgi:hypothetical protein